MSDRFNTIAGWTLFSGIVLLGLSAVSSRYFHAGKEQRPETMGYEIAGVVQEGEGAKETTPFEAFLAKADMAKGEKTFAKCASCHTINQGGANGLGPNLYGVMGEAVAQGRGGFPFSEALKSKGGKWDWPSMSDWLTNPAAHAPGTKMTFAGLPDAQERANLMVYLNAQGSNLALPPVPEAPAAGAEPAAAAIVGDAAKGQKSFAKCAACHTIDPGGANGIGPNLAGIHDEAVAQGRGGYAFSDALKAKGGKWDDAALDAWLTDPAKYAAGTKMTFAGLSDPQERANVIAYLKTVN